MQKQNLILIGFQASGKTTLGQLIAAHLNKIFLDSDRLIEQRHPGQTCSMIFHRLGDVYFRQMESTLIQELEQSENIVLAVGGGAILNEDNRRFLKRLGLCVYLKTSQEIVKERLWNRPSLPAYLDAKQPDSSFAELYRFRSALYERMADVTLDMDGLNPQKALDHLMHSLN